MSDYFYACLSVLVTGYMVYYFINYLIIQLEIVYLDDTKLVKLEELLWENESKQDDIIEYPLYPTRFYTIIDEEGYKNKGLNQEYLVININKRISLYNNIYENVVEVNKDTKIGINYTNLGRVFIKIYNNAPNKISIHNIKFIDELLNTSLEETKEIVVIEVEPDKYLEIVENGGKYEKNR